MLTSLGTVKIKDNTPTIEEDVVNIQHGNLKLKEDFILTHKPFVMGCVENFKKDGALDYSSDEFSIALIAFNEAINTFNIVKGKSFLNYARLVINNRLTDYARKQRGGQNLVSLEVVENSLEQESSELDRVEVAQEIEMFVKSLKRFKISLGDLVRLSPKEEPSRQRLICIARKIHDDKELLTSLRRTRKLPINEILPKTDVSRSTIELNRKYIIALVLIMDSQLETIKGYLQKAERSANYGY